MKEIILKQCKLHKDREYIDNSIVYKIVNQFYLFAGKYGNDSVNLPCTQVWWEYSRDFAMYETYVAVARRYGFATLKRRGEKWCELDKKSNKWVKIMTRNYYTGVTIMHYQF